MFLIYSAYLKRDLKFSLLNHPPQRKSFFTDFFSPPNFTADENVTLSNMTDFDQTDHDNVTLNITGEFLGVVRLVYLHGVQHIMMDVSLVKILACIKFHLQVPGSDVLV